MPKTMKQRAMKNSSVTITYAVTVKRTYKLSIGDKDAMQKKCSLWSEELNVELPYDFMRYITNVNSFTNTNKFCSFHIRLMCQAVITNVHLLRWGLRESNLCSFCEKEEKSYLHLFVYCEH